MTTRAQRLSEHIAVWAGRSPSVLIGLSVVGVVMCVFCAGLALTALFMGPIGVALLDPFLGGALSRLSVIQVSVFLGILSISVSFVLIACWKEAPPVMRTLMLSAFLERISRRLQNGLRPGPSLLYWGLVGACAIWVNVEILWRLPVLACLEPDTVGYLVPSALRSSGYFLFLKSVVALTGDLHWVVPVQLNLMLLSFATLGYSVRVVLGSFGAGLISAVVPMVSSAVLILAPAVMSEALFVALICFHIAASIWSMRFPTWRAYAMSGLFLGTLILVRPNGISFVVPAAFLFFIAQRHRLKALTGMLLPVIVLVGAQGIFNQTTFGFFGLHKFGGISLAGNFAPIIRGDMGGEYPELAQRLEREMRHYSRDFPPFEERAFPYEMADVAGLTAVGAIYKVLLPAIREELALPTPQAVSFEYDPRISAITSELALTAVKNDPFGAAKIVLSNFIANWHMTLPVRVPMSIYYPRCLKLSQAVLAGHEDLLSSHTDTQRYIQPSLSKRMADIETAGIRGIEMPRLILSALQAPLAYLALALATVGFVWGLWRGRALHHDAQVWAYTSICLYAGYGVISIGNTAFTRYTVVFDPIVITMLVGGVLVALRWLYRSEKQIECENR